LLIMIYCSSISAQGVGIGTDKPDSSSVLHISSTSQGLLPPRMTQAQIFAMPAPASGLMVYNIDRHKLVYFDSSKWKFVSTEADMEIKVGDTYAGGMVIYVDSTTVHGIVVATANQSVQVSWGCTAAVSTSTELGSGPANTNAIDAACPYVPAGDPFGNAAHQALVAINNGYTDWYLPSRDEFAKICAAPIVLPVGNYHTSSLSESEASVYYFTGQPCTPQANGDKTTTRFVRVVRSF